MRPREAAQRIGFRIRRSARPLVTVSPPPAGVRLDRDVEVAVRDGTILRVNVFRPAGDHGPRPVIMCAHPYGKDALPRPARGGRGHAPPLQIRMLPQSEPYTISAWTSWEAPDPGFWVPRGYVLVNADLRGWGRSDGVGELLSAQEADDYHDLIEWAGTRSWSNGRVGLTGVSYLALSQWGAAATRPAHLAAICPWEGFTDAYRDFMRPGGIRERGFVVIWARGLAHAQHRPIDLEDQQRRRPRFDRWWADRNRDLERVDVPALVCGSFSDHNLHSGGSFHGFARIGSAEKWLFTHRGPKWATYYGPEGRAAQAQFFDHFLRADDTGLDADRPVRIEVREDASTVVDVRHERSWPLPTTEWRTLRLDAATGCLEDDDDARRSEAQTAFDSRRGRAGFTHRFAADTEVTGPMAVRLHVHVDGADDLCAFVGVRKRRDGRVVGFEGAYGFPHALVTVGWLRASQRAVDPERSTPWEPWHPHDRTEPLRPGTIVPLDIGLLPSATQFRAGDELELLVQGRWFFWCNPFVGQFPARYEHSRAARVVLHTGGDHPSTLLLPVVPPSGVGVSGRAEPP